MSRRLRTTTGLLLMFLVAGAACRAPEPVLPRAEDGVLDLSSWDPERDGAVRLDGKWGFHWRRLVDPGRPATRSEAREHAEVPGSWPGADGFATYRLSVRLPPGEHELALRLLTVSTAYRLYVDGELAAARGRVAETAASAAPEYRPTTLELTAGGERPLELVLQASNFHYAKGGLWEPIWLGSPAALGKLREANVALTFFLVGTFGIIGLYHLFIWLARRSEPSALYFGIMCVAVIARILTVDEMYLVTLVPSLPWSLHVRIEYLSIIVIGALYAPFLRTLFPEEVPRWLAPVVVLAGTVLALAVIVAPPVVFSQGLPLLQLYLVSGTLIAAALTTRALLHGRPGAGLFLLGILAVMVASVHDTLLSILRDLPTMQFLGGSIYVLPYALFICALSQAVVLALRYSGAFAQLETASAQLRETHAELDAHARELEQRVAARTHDLEKANQQLARLASIDGLTLVGNRRFFEEALARLWAEHERREAPLSLVLCDVDHFKHFNDTYGHVKGDETLRAVAEALTRAASRPGDTVARYGGEELVALLPDTDDAGALEVAERIRRNVEDLDIPHDASDVVPFVSLSVGVATLVPRRDTPPGLLVEHADAALYLAKEHGRNRVEPA
jgi:diguanylate cyclase (GGDEF)-like protein